MFIKSFDNSLFNIEFIAELFMAEYEYRRAVCVVVVYPTFTKQVQITDYIKQEDAEKEFDKLEKLLVKG